jgi:cytidylate kinase
MGWFFVRDSLKVRLTVDPDVAAHRIFSDTAEMRGLSGENFQTLQTAIAEVDRRKRSEVMRYSKLYSVDISDPANFDLVINTSHKAPDDVTREFEEKFALYKASH